MSDHICVSGCVLSYPHLFSADRYGRYSAAFVLEKGGPGYQAAAERVKAAIKGLSGKPTAGKVCLAADDERGDGWFVLRARNETPPKLADQRNRPCDQPELFYPGAIVDAFVEVYAWDNENGRGVSARLHGVRHMGEGERLDNRPPEKTHEELFGSAPAADPKTPAGSEDAPDDFDDDIPF